jgi:hypothetical protein
VIQVVIPKWLNPRGKIAMECFTAGLRRLGVDVMPTTLKSAVPSTEPMVCWGVFKERLKDRVAIRDLQRAQRALGDLVIVERGFVNREDTYMVGWNDINGRAAYAHDLGGCPSDRWDALKVELEPWRTSGHEVLVIGQVPWDTSCQHADMAKWVSETCTRLKGQRIGPVVFRPHPLQPRAIPTRGLAVDAVDLDRPLREALKSARLVLTFCSNVGVDATIMGVRAMADDPTSMIHGVRQEQRESWAHWLAYCQWSLSEIANGLAWQHLYPKVPA